MTTLELSANESRDQYITEHIPLIWRAVKKFVNKYPHLAYLQDDLFSAGQIGLVNAVDRMSKVDVHKPRLYMTMAIQREIQACADDEESMRIPTRTKSDRKKKGKEPINTMDREPYDEEELDTKPSKYRSHEHVEAEEWTSSLCLSERELQIIAIRLQDYDCTQEQIASELGIHKSTVSRTLQRLEQRIIVANLRVNDYSIEQISEKLDIDENDVIRVFDELDGRVCNTSDDEKVELPQRNYDEIESAFPSLAT